MSSIIGKNLNFEVEKLMIFYVHAAFDPICGRQGKV
jgi:hypothetical protein